MQNPAWSNSLGSSKREALGGAFFWLTAFYFVYCARPEDLVPLPFLAKISIAGVILSMLSSGGRTERKLKDLPIEGKYLVALSAILFIGSLLSPVWKGGAFLSTIEFSKVIVAWILTFLVVTSMQRLRRIIFVQAGAVAVIAALSIIKGYHTPRLNGVMGGIYENPNDLAFAIVLSLPFCYAFLFSSKNMLVKIIWIAGMLAMLASLFLTASRAGFIDLLVSGSVALWHFGVRGKRMYLIVVVAVLGTLFFAIAGKNLRARFEEIEEQGANREFSGAYGSYEMRQFLMFRAVEVMETYPLLGVGVHNFVSISGDWHEVHMSYLEIGAEGGIPVLILYLLFFYRGFVNLKYLRRRKDLDREMVIFVGALHSSLVGFVFGALFAPEAYHFFPYFTVAFTSVMVALAKEKSTAGVPATEPRKRLAHWSEVYDIGGKVGPVGISR
ncbi:MAG TPA: O-antigen ligase family protein [Candidatus Aquilonibacter sp.]|nr:O-antigen ligase family protein [Candidatus Aquilonibacter sp.]